MKLAPYPVFKPGNSQKPQKRTSNHKETTSTGWKQKRLDITYKNIYVR